MRSKISLGDDQQVSKDGDEGFPAAVVDRALLGDERGAFLEKGFQRVGGRNRLRPQALAQVTPNAGDSMGTGHWGGEFSWYRMRHAGSGHVVVVLVLSLYQLRLRGIVLDPDRTVHIRDIPAARLAELHLPLVQAPHRLADAAGEVRHAIDRAAPVASADRRVLGGDGADLVLHGAVCGRADAAHGAVSRSVFDRHTLFILVLGLCIGNGIFSPYLNLAIPVTAVLLPEIFPRTVQWVLFWSSVLLSTTTLLVSGVPAALYERLVERDPNAVASTRIWFVGAAALCLPAVLRML